MRIRAQLKTTRFAITEDAIRFLGRVLVEAAALATLLAVGTTARALGPNKCLGTKNKCASKKMQGLLKCYNKAAADPAKQGGVFTECHDKAIAKYDGGPDASKGCFAKAETKNDGPCVTANDASAIENKVDSFVTDVVTELDNAGAATFETVNACQAAKDKCVLKKAAGILKCHEKAVEAGSNTDLQTCIDKARAKFDGGTDASKACFAKAEAKGGCSTSSDTVPLENKVDAFVLDVLCELGYGAPGGTVNCSGVCGNSSVEPGEDCDPPGTQCPNAAAGILCSSTCQCACPGSIEFTGTSTDGVLDIGWTGSAHDSTIVSDGTVTVHVDSCAHPDRPCGVCTVTGPIPNAGAALGTMNNQRCAGDTRVTCHADTDCASAGGPCTFYFGTLLPIIGGGIGVCVENSFNGTFSGTANIETGAAANSPRVSARIFNGSSVDHPCPRCLGDGSPNDGIRGGTCDDGRYVNQACDRNGSSPNIVLGSTSLDCPPLQGAQTGAALLISLNTTTGTATKTLSVASPDCRGQPGSKCMCDTCNSAGASPCSTNADCPDPPGPIGPICGGARCLGGGSNTGAGCLVGSECPGGACGFPGLATRPNQCDGGPLDCAATGSPGPNQGVCQTGPFETFCSPTETRIQCGSDANCSYPGDTCSLGVFRPCYLDRGVIGGTDTASGVTDLPVNDGATPTLAALFCVGPASTSINSAAGLPGLGRLVLMGRVQGRP